MKCVADANILFALSKPDSVASEIAASKRLLLLAPEFALVELNKYQIEILSKSGAKDFKDVVESLKKRVVFIAYEEYKSEMENAAKKISDKKDAPYLALAQKFSIPIWSNDPDLKEQNEVGVFTTKELIGLLKNSR